MSLSIWTQCGGRSNLRALAGAAWRVVESQHLISTLKLVDSRAEQEVLERLIEDQKPPRRGSQDRALHYLLFTPFRYPPLPHGSRFGRRTEPGVWYGSRERRTAFAEVAYYRLLLAAGTETVLDRHMVELSTFQARYATRAGIDLTREPFARHESKITAPDDYSSSQELGGEMREAGVEVFRYRSARDPERGINVGLFAPRAFRGAVSALETWECIVSEDSVELVKKDPFSAYTFRFEKETFLVRGSLPSVLG